MNPKVYRIALLYLGTPLVIGLFFIGVIAALGSGFYVDFFKVALVILIIATIFFRQFGSTALWVCAAADCFLHPDHSLAQNLRVANVASKKMGTTFDNQARSNHILWKMIQGKNDELSTEDKDFFRAEGNGRYLLPNTRNVLILMTEDSSLESFSAAATKLMGMYRENGISYLFNRVEQKSFQFGFLLVLLFATVSAVIFWVTGVAKDSANILASGVLGGIVSIPLLYTVLRLYYWPREIYANHLAIQVLRQADLSSDQKREQLKALGFPLQTY
jgi:hypothetical protein